jgi:hypothetical protein
MEQRDRRGWGGVGEGGSIRATARTGLLDKDDSCALLLLQERGGGKDPGAGGIVLLLRVGDDGDHGVEFLPELGGLGSLVGVVGGHQRWCRGAQEGGMDHRRCSGRREGGKPLGFERSGSEKNLDSDYHVGERHTVKYLIGLY